MHLCHEVGGAGETRVVLKVLGLPDSTRVIAVGLHGEACEWQQVDTVTFLQRFDIRVADGYTQYGGNQCTVAGCGSHPLNVVVTPLDVIIANGGQHIQNLLCTRSTVEDVAHDMERIDYQTMNEIADCDDHLLSTTGVNDSLQDRMVVILTSALDVGFVQ